jgi:hypothetical protein
MQGYAMNRPLCCRRRFLAKALGDSVEEVASIKCTSCDVCCVLQELTSKASRCDFTRETLTVLDIIDKHTAIGKKITFKQLVDETLKSEKKNDKDRLKKVKGSKVNVESQMILGDFEKCEWFCAYLFLDNVIMEDYHYTAYSTIIYVKSSMNASNVRNGVTKVMIQLPVHFSLNQPPMQNEDSHIQQPQNEEVIEIESSDDDFEPVQKKKK